MCLCLSVPACCEVAALQQDPGDLPGGCECQAKALLNLARQWLCVTAHVSWYMYHARKTPFLSPYVRL